MFARLPPEAGDAVTLSIDGKACTARATDTVAAALLASGLGHCRLALLRRPPPPFDWQE